MVSDSAALEKELGDIRRRAEQLLSGLTPQQLTLRPNPAKWSIAECLSHLNKTAAVMQPKVAAAIAQGKKEKVFAKGPFAPGPMGRLLIWIAEPPPKFRLRAPKNIAPAAVGDTSQVVADFIAAQDGWERLFREAEGLDQKKLKVASLLRGMPRLRLAAPIPWMMAHQRRHLLQAENVKRQIISPAPAGSGQSR